MTVQELVNFRTENTRELQTFRACMLGYAKTLNAQISENTPADEVNIKAKFLIETEIHPALHDLNRDLLNPNRSWTKRMADGVKIVSSVALGYVTAGALGKTIASGLADFAASEIESRGGRQSVKQNGLYYILKAKTIGR
jgi:hypothetical protein